MPLKLRAIIPKHLFNDKAIFNSLRAEANVQIRIIDRLYAKTYRTWSSKPTFDITDASTRTKISVRTGTNFPKMLFLDEGTRIRWAIMSGDFSAKTRPRAIGSRSGRGGAVIVGKRAMQARGIPPRPGIKAREFTTTIVDRRQKPYAKAMTGALRRGVASVKTFRK